jgi:hypothetical protein
MSPSILAPATVTRLRAPGAGWNRWTPTSPDCADCASADRAHSESEQSAATRARRAISLAGRRAAVGRRVRHDALSTPRSVMGNGSHTGTGGRSRGRAAASIGLLPSGYIASRLSLETKTAARQGKRYPTTADDTSAHVPLSGNGNPVGIGKRRVAATSMPAWIVIAPVAASTSTFQCLSGAVAGDFRTAPFRSNSEPWQSQRSPWGEMSPSRWMSHWMWVQTVDIA